jgi:hypothetical protein
MYIRIHICLYTYIRICMYIYRHNCVCSYDRRHRCMCMCVWHLTKEAVTGLLRSKELFNFLKKSLVHLMGYVSGSSTLMHISRLSKFSRVLRRCCSHSCFLSRPYVHKKNMVMYTCWHIDE